MARRFAKLALAAAMAFGVFKGAQAGFDAPPGQLRPTFNTAATAHQPAAKQVTREYRLPSAVIPANVDEVWRVRLGSWDMAAGGHHTFLEFAPYREVSKSNPSGNEIYQVHGIAMDERRLTWAMLEFDKPAAYSRYAHSDYVLKAFGANEDYNRKIFGKDPDAYVDVFYGSKDEVLKMYMDCLTLTVDINMNSDTYRLVDHNSNSVQRTMLEALGFPVPGLYAPHILNTIGNDRIWTPGMELNLLPQDWDRETAREKGGYGKLSGAALEAAARKGSLGQPGVWIKERSRPDFKPGS